MQELAEKEYKMLIDGLNLQVCYAGMQFSVSVHTL
jgi:hypothetical protein